jgi:hypothetical protein
VVFDPHPIGDTARTTKTVANVNRKPNFRWQTFIQVSNKASKTAQMDNRPGGPMFGPILRGAELTDVAPEVKIVRLETADVAPGVTDIGEKEQAAPGGSPDEHVSETGLENAPCGADATATA